MEQVLHKVNHYSSLSAPDRVAARAPPDCGDRGSARRRCVPSHLLPEARVPRWRSRLHACRQQRRRVVLPLHQGDAAASDNRATDAMLISVVVATYNRPDALAAVLRSLGKQNDRQFEVVVADDGSRSDTEDVVQRAQAAFPVPLTHVWQEDTGFRLAAVRNRATARARGEYLIYLDGDCIVRPNFVRAHRDLAETGWCVTGGRVLLSEAFTHQVLATDTAIEDWSIADAAVAALQGKLNRAMSLPRLPLGPLRKAWSAPLAAAQRLQLQRVSHRRRKSQRLRRMFSGMGL